MQIILKQRAIEKALRLYVANQGINLEGKTLKIDFTAGRKESGMTAEVEILDAEDLAELSTAMVSATAALAAAGTPAVEQPITSIPAPAPAPAPVAPAPVEEVKEAAPVSERPVIAAGTSLFS